jgi:hypothetical protein
MQYIKWILLGICLLAVVWPLLFKQPSDQKKDAEPKPKDQ